MADKVIQLKIIKPEGPEYHYFDNEVEADVIYIENMNDHTIHVQYIDVPKDSDDLIRLLESIREEDNG